VDYDPVSVGDCTVTSDIQFHSPAAPGRVPEGPDVAGTPMTVRRGALPGEVVIEWQPTCDADDHAIYFGTLGSFDSYAFAECDVGTSGSWPVTLPGGDLFWVVVGQNSVLEGSYGVNSDLVERPDDGGILCGDIQDLTATCVP
jgi:hypothetical protein